jgi:hypothetical protein
LCTAATALRNTYDPLEKGTSPKKGDSPVRMVIPFSTGRATAYTLESVVGG